MDLCKRDKYCSVLCCDDDATEKDIQRLQKHIGAKKMKALKHIKETINYLLEGDDKNFEILKSQYENNKNFNDVQK